MKVHLKDYLHFFGYASHPDMKSDVQTFMFEDQKDEDLDQYNGFMINNEAALQLSKKEDALNPNQEWHVNQGQAV